jgi:hypothetical protein
MSDGDVCKQTDGVIKTISTAPIIAINDLKAQAKKASQRVFNSTSAEAGKKKTWIKNRVDNVKQFYNRLNRAPPKSARPDLVFFRNVLLFIASLVIIYYALPYISGKVQTGFTKEQFEKAVKLPESAFNIEQVAQVNQKIKAFEDHKAYFDDGGAYAPDNAGTHEVGKTAVALPMLIFFLQFILPPLAIGYTIWFVITYWHYVYQALWGWFLAMYDYFTTLVQGKMGCKWYIRFVTGWRCRNVSFYDYVVRWRQRYIDGPVRQEQIKYINQYYAAKERYVTKPYKKYISDPLERRKIKAEYARRVTSERTMEVLLKKARDSSRTVDAGITGTLLKGTVFGQLFGKMFNTYIGNPLNNIKSASSDIANGFDSQTVTGNQCRCPGASEKTASTLTKGVHFVKTHLPEFHREGKTAKARRNCEVANQVIRDRASLIGSLIVLILAILIAIYMYAWKFGTPVFIKNIISNTSVWGVHHMIGKRWTVLPYIVVITTLAILAHTGFS